MQDLRTRWLQGALGTAGLGALAGALEVVGLAALSRAPLEPVGVATLGVAAVVAMTVVGLGVGLLTGLAHLAAKGPAAQGLQVGLGAGLLAAWHTVPATALLLGEGRLPAGLPMAAAPLGLAALVGLYARFFARRAEAYGEPPPVAWLPLSAGLSVILVAGAVFAAALRVPVGPEGGARALIVTVDGLSAGALDAPPDAIRFSQAVTPLPATRPAAATVLTSLHPLRHRVLDDEGALGREWAPLPEVVAQAGFGTAAFVSSRALGADSGLAQGFGVYDDVRWGPWGLSVARRLGLGPARRAPSDTVAAFAAWRAWQGDRGFVAWVHLDGSDPAAVAAALADLRGAVGDAPTLLVVAGAWGATEGLGEPAVRVPLWVVAPGWPTKVTDVAAQVRLMDVAPTVAAWLGLPSLEPSEGVDLLGYASGVRQRSMSCTLVGADADGTPLIGLRSGEVKYVRALPDGPERLFDLSADPAGARDVAADQPAALEQARGLVGADQAALLSLLGGT